MRVASRGALSSELRCEFRRLDRDPAGHTFYRTGNHAHPLATLEGAYVATSIRLWSGSRKYTDIIRPRAPICSMGPASSLMPQLDNRARTASILASVMKHKSAPPGCGTAAWGSYSLPRRCRLIF